MSVGFLVLICQLSDVGKGRLNSKRTRICLIYCVVFCYLRLCQGDGSFTKSLGTNILWPHAKLLPASISFVESMEGQCLLTVYRVVKDRRIPEQIGSPVDNKICLQFLLRMAPLYDGDDIVWKLVGWRWKEGL